MVQSPPVVVNPPIEERRETGQVDGAGAGRQASPAREKLLAAVIAHVTAHGIGDLSLREVAAAIGTSHRMLIYHFGSREGLMVAIVHAVEAGQHAFLGQLAADSSLSPADVMRAMWRRLAEPELWPSERLFFEIYALALQRRPGTDGFLDGIVDSWVEQMSEYARQRGMDPHAARVDARVGVAISRGLLLDLLATGDRAAVDAAVERYLAGYQSLTGENLPPGRDQAGVGRAGR